MIDGRKALRGHAAALLAFALLAGCGQKPAPEPQAAAEPQPMPAPAAPREAGTGDAQADVAAGDASVPPPAAPAGALRDTFARCIEAAGGVDAAMQDCIGDEYEYQDGRLNAAYAGLKRTLADADMQQLRAAQRQWLRERDGRCTWDAETEGSAQRLQANQCRLDATAARAAELEAMR